MSTVEDVYRAEQLATSAHAGQVDKAGGPYIEHPAGVAFRLEGAELVVRVVAWLHDVVEDTDVTADDVVRQFGAEVAAAVDAITHRAGESNLDYYARVKANPVAFQVKGADLADNTDPLRTRLLKPEQRARLAAKYETAYAVLGLVPAAPIVRDGRLPVTVGDLVSRGNDELIIAWVGPKPADAVAVFTRCAPGEGAWRGTATTPGVLRYHGAYGDQFHLFSVPGAWTVTGPQWS